MARLAGLAANGGTPGHVVKKYVTRTDAYKNTFIKKERIAGERPGTPTYKERAIRQIINVLSEPSHPKYKFYWTLYKDAAIAFIKAELPQLDKLLAEVQVTEGPTEIADLFRTVCANAAEFGVSPDHITSFYDVWGVPRIEDFDAQLQNWLKDEDGNAPKRQLARLTSEMTKLRALVEELGATVRKHEEVIAEDGNDVYVSLEQHRTLEQRVQLLSQQVSDQLATSAKDETTKRIDERVAGLAEKLNRLTEKVKVPREEVSTKDLQKLANETKLGIASSVSDLTDALTKKLREELSAATGELEAKITALSSELSKRREGIATTTVGNAGVGGYRSPLIGIHSHSHAPYRLTAELDFVNSWRHYLSQSYDIALTFEQAVAYHRAFLGSPVVVCDRIFALSWIHCLAWQPFTLHMAASPTWSSEEDWAQGAEHLFRRDSGRSPRLLVLHNYDVGLPDCYLAPSLALWALQRESAGLSKLFLLPARLDHPPSAQVLEHAVCFSNNEYITTRPLELKDGVRLPPTPHREPPLGAEPKVVAQWSAPHAHIAYDLASIERAIKCRMMVDLAASFDRTASFIARYVDEASAIALTMHHQVIPWIQATYGEAKATELSNLIKTMAGSPD